jgi:ATP-binding cassette subfamily B protein
MTFQQKRIPRTPDTPLAFIAYVLRHCSTGMKWRAFFGCVCQAIATTSDILVSWVMGRIVAAILAASAHPWPAIMHEISLLAGLWILRDICLRLCEYFERNYVPELLNTTRELLFNRLIQQSQNFLHSNFAGVLANHVRRAGDVIGTLRDKMQGNIIPLIFRFLVAGILMWQITPLFDAFMLFFIVLGIVCAIKSAPKWTGLSTAQAEANSRMTGYVVDSVTNLSLVQHNVGWREEQNRLHYVHQAMNKTYKDRLVFASWFWGTFDLVMTAFSCGFMMIVAYSWQQGHVTTAQLAMTIGIVSNLFGTIAGTVSLLSSKFDDFGILRDSLQKISTPLSIIDKPAAPDLSLDKGRIEFRDVTFGYTEGRYLFKHLTLDIPAGQKVGFVGISGAGKTTLCQLLLRAYDVNQGGIYIDDQNIAEVTQDSLHAAIAVIPQDPALFHRTLQENIRYGRQSATDEEVKTAASAAAVSSFIEDLPETYNTLVGERGIKLSGGQRQRIAIARAIVKNAEILVLDEATSALDSETEKSIQAAMIKAMQGRTTLVIAHRLSTLSYMDRIVVMEQGRIIEDGTFDQLIASKGTFYRLWTLQAGGFLPDHLS